MRSLTKFIPVIFLGFFVIMLISYWPAEWVFEEDNLFFHCLKFALYAGGIAIVWTITVGIFYKIGRWIGEEPMNRFLNNHERIMRESKGDPKKIRKILKEREK